MNTRLFADLFTIIVLTYWTGCWAYAFGQWLGWVTDAEQWPRQMAALLLDIFRWDRSIVQDMKAFDELQVVVDWKIAGGRAPRGTPEASK